MSDKETALAAIDKFIAAREHLDEHPLSSSALEEYKYAWTEVLKHADYIREVVCASESIDFKLKD